MFKKVILIILVFIVSTFMLGSKKIEKNEPSVSFIKASFHEKLNIDSVISSEEELSYFLKSYNSLLNLDEDSINNLYMKYDKEYFEKNVIEILYFTETSSSITYKTNDVNLIDGKINVDIEKQYPDRVTCDMVGWILIVEKSFEIKNDEVILNFI